MSRALLILFYLAGFHASAQEKPWPPAEWADTSVFYGGKNISPSQNLKGFVLLKNGDSLNGYIQFVIKHFPQEHKHNGCWLLPENKNTPIWLNVRKIRKIRVEAASLGRNFTAIYTLPISRPNYSFWRLIAKKGAVAIYDRSLGMFSHVSRWTTWNKYRNINIAADEFNEDMFLITNTDPVKIYGSYALYKFRDRPAELILKFINDRYHKSFKQADFKTKMDLINYVLDAENARLAAEGE